MARPRKPMTRSPLTQNRHARMRIEARREDIEWRLRIGLTLQDVAAWLKKREGVEADEELLRLYLEQRERGSENGDI